MPAWAVWGGLLQQGALRARLAVVYGSGHKVERDEPEEVSGPQKCFWGNSLTGCSVKRVWWLIRQAWSLLPSIARFQLCALLVSERGLKAPGSPVKGLVCSESLPDSSVNFELFFDDLDCFYGACFGRCFCRGMGDGLLGYSRSTWSLMCLGSWWRGSGMGRLRVWVRLCQYCLLFPVPVPASTPGMNSSGIITWGSTGSRWRWRTWPALTRSWLTTCTSSQPNTCSW